MTEPDWREPYVITVAPNGARRTKADHPALPMTQNEIVDAVADAHAAGAHGAHVHVRDEQGAHVLDAQRYRDVIDALRVRCGDDLIVQVTTEAVGRYTAAEQRQLVRDVRPQAMSVAFRELYSDAADDAENDAFVAWAAKAGIAIQWIMYDGADLAALAERAEAGDIANVDAVLFVLGRYAQGQRSAPADVIPLLNTLKTHTCLQHVPWTVCAFGAAETACLTTALMLGGDARIGFENSLWHADGRRAASNADRVAALRDIASRLGLVEASPAQARERLAIRHG